MYNYVNDNFLGNLPEEMIDVLLELYNTIKDKFKFINKNTNVVNIDESLENVDLIMDSLNKLADMLEMNSLFEEEYYLSLSIINDIEYIALDKKDLSQQNLIFIANIVINFCNLIRDKQDLLLSNNHIDYKKEYNEFIIFYNNQKEYFYNNIAQKNEDYDELIDKVTNILW